MTIYSFCKRYSVVTSGVRLRVAELGLARLVWEWARRTSRAERLVCAAALALLLLCAALAASLAGPRAPPEPDSAPHEWNITRRMWLSSSHSEAERFAPRFRPLRLAVVQHTAGAQCERFSDCAALMRNMQRNFLRDRGFDLPYNFVVGNDGRVYEGRGWALVGAHTLGLNRCALGLGFTGDYRAEGGAAPRALQLNRTLQLLQGGVRAGLLHARYRVLAARDVRITASPGERLAAALAAWPQFDAGAARFANLTCDEIYDELRAGDPHLPAV